MADDVTIRVQPKLALTAARPHARLQWQAGTHEVTDTVLLGSSEHATVVLNDRHVSRLHCELSVRADGLWVRDLGSKNGTWLEGLQVNDAKVPDAGGTLKVGHTEVAITFGKPQSAPLWPKETYAGMVGRSEGMRALFNRIADLKKSQACALIQGETGTGKELIARAIHAASPRAAAPFIIVDCGALPEALFESELFGHAKGAFTGADHSRVGAIEAAHGGTVFLDEVGELPLSVQPRLLRALETKTIRRVGENEHHAVDVRFIAATHRDLQSMVAAGTFREDLYFRLAVLPVRVAALRQRPEDIGPLLSHFLGRDVSTLPKAALDQALAYAWPGNVRELKSFAERVEALGPDAALELLGTGKLESVPAPVSDGGLEPIRAEVPFKVLRERWADYLEREYLAKLVAKHGRNTATLSEAAGLDRSYVHRLLKKHGL
ncbi:MAG: sigma 54-dependent Fis family transcriptional regulator [Myxococcaceae bacterium]|nr:sigma 54-dependent Fis family transcriptional regulator [Myxococcaceae bacterium]